MGWIKLGEDTVEVRAVLNGEHARMYQRLKEEYEREDGQLSDSAVLRRLVYRAYKLEGRAK